jgi:hypothetical protein
MCQALHPRSQNPPRHLADKMGYPPKNLPWTDKFCHFVMFETTKAPPQSERQRSCVMRCASLGSQFFAGAVSCVMQPKMPYSELSTLYCVLNPPATPLSPIHPSKSVFISVNPWLAFSSLSLPQPFHSSTLMSNARQEVALIYGPN